VRLDHAERLGKLGKFGDRTAPRVKTSLPATD